MYPATFQLADLDLGSGACKVIAQSIGGAGGAGGMNISGGLQLSTDKSSGGAGLVVGVGGYGGIGGNADQVDVTINGGGSITAQGIGKSAVAAISLGGSGGSGGTNISGGVTSGTPITVGIGGNGGAAGIGEDVNATVTSDLYITADGVLDDDKSKPFCGRIARPKHWRWRQWGNEYLRRYVLCRLKRQRRFLVVWAWRIWGIGNVSGNVVVNHAGNIVAKGELVQGLGAQSIGGGGGNGAMNITGTLSWGDGDTKQSELVLRKRWLRCNLGMRHPGGLISTTGSQVQAYPPKASVVVAVTAASISPG